MTPEEQAARGIWSTCMGSSPYNLIAEHGPLTRSVVSKCCEFHVKIAQAIVQARREEREACAMIADAPEWDWHSSGHGDEQWPCLSAQTIAAAIRARAQESER